MCCAPAADGMRLWLGLVTVPLALPARPAVLVLFTLCALFLLLVGACAAAAGSAPAGSPSTAATLLLPAPAAPPLLLLPPVILHMVPSLFTPLLLLLMAPVQLAVGHTLLLGLPTTDPGPMLLMLLVCMTGRAEPPTSGWLAGLLLSSVTSRAAAAWLVLLVPAACGLATGVAEQSQPWGDLSVSEKRPWDLAALSGLRRAAKLKGEGDEAVRDLPNAVLISRLKTGRGGSGPAAAAAAVGLVLAVPSKLQLLAAAASLAALVRPAAGGSLGDVLGTGDVSAAVLLGCCGLPAGWLGALSKDPVGLLGMSRRRAEGTSLRGVALPVAVSAAWLPAVLLPVPS